MARRQEGGGECARSKREHREAVPQALSGFPGAQEGRDDLRFTEGACGVGGAPGSEKVQDLRDHPPRMKSHRIIVVYGCLQERFERGQGFS